MQKPFAFVLTVALALIASVACASPAAPSPTASDVPPTPRPTTAPTDTPTTPPTITPTDRATATPEPSPVRTIALFSAGSGGEARLHGLLADDTTVDLGRSVGSRATASEDGRWVATSNSEQPPDAVLAFNLATDETFSVPVTSDFDPYGMAFDSGATRLAFLELGAPGENGVPWAIVVVSMADGSATRFDATTGMDNNFLPGNPIGWADDELLLNTFLPYSDAPSAGLVAVRIPPDTESGPLEALQTREVLPGDRYLWRPRLSPDAAQLLYLNRDYDYTPDSYGPVGYDLAVNQLGLLDLTTGSTSMLVEETEGGALGGDVAWSPDGTAGLFAEGRYAGNTFSSLTLRMISASGTVTDVAPVPLPSEGFLVSLEWCLQSRGLTVVATSEGMHELHTMDLTSGDAATVTADEEISVLGCVAQAGDKADAGADAGVVHVRAVESTEGTWTFHVTVRHPDTGWEDYANGWDVVAPDGTVLKPEGEGDFTRTLLHPHVDEQPFTRSQSGIVIPDGVTKVRVRAHDIVDGFGGREVVVDLTESSGPDFEVERQ